MTTITFSPQQDIAVMRPRISRSVVIVPPRPGAGWHELRFTAAPDKVEIACAACGLSMWFPPCKAGKYKTCGGACSKALRASQVEKRRTKCATCAKEFTPRRVQVTNGGGIFCSQRCNTNGRTALNAPEAKRKAAARTKAMRAAGLIKHKSGPEHPDWKGGIKAHQKRRQESGKNAASTKAYRHKKPHKAREFAQRRRSRTLGRLPNGTIPRIGKAQRWKCAICRTSIKDRYHVDHVKPVALGGAHAPSNLQLLCPPCNIRKSAKDPIEYMRSLGRLL